MAIYRNVQLTFWTDPETLDDYTPEDKYFYLYLLTNPQTNMCGCYQLSWTATTSQLGYSKDTVIRLLERFEYYHHVIKFSKETKEVLLLNWHKYNWQGGNQVTCLENEIANIKDRSLKEYVSKLFSERFEKPLTRPLQATVTDTITDTVTDNSSVSNIVNYLNKVVGTNYRVNSKNTVKHISARLSEGYTEEEFYLVIDKMHKKWGSDTKMAAYLRPETLFGTKFESYLNMQVPVEKSEMDEWAELLEAEKESAKWD